MESIITQLQTPYIVGIGAANVDAIWQSNAPINLRDSNPAQRLDSVGGVTRNICENIARLGGRVSLLTAVGDDAGGDTILAVSDGAGIDVSHVRRVKGAKSTSYIAVLDDTGDMLVGLSDMRLIQTVSPDYIEENVSLLQGAHSIVCDGVLPVAVLETLVSFYGDKCLADPVSIAYAKKIKPLVGKLFCVKPNRYELEVLSGILCQEDKDVERAAEALLRQGTHTVLVSLGAKGCYYADREGKRFFRSIAPLEQMANATGAGDAFLGAFTVALTRGLSVERCVEYALAAGRIAAESAHTVATDMSTERIEETLSRYGTGAL